MKVAGGGFEPCYNAQAVVDTESMLVLATHVTQATNDKEQVEPMLEKIHANPEGLNGPDTGLADTGDYSAKNVDLCVAAKIEPLIAVKREAHLRTGATVLPNRCHWPTMPHRSRPWNTNSKHGRDVPPTRDASRRSSRCSASSSR